MQDIIINNRYRVDREIGSGGFGAVYQGTDLQTGGEIALKFSHCDISPEIGLGSLKGEKDKYDILEGGVGIPRALWYGVAGEYRVLVCELGGPSLIDLLSYCGKFSLKTVLMIADQAISRIQYMHSKGILHRDIKPENFIMGTGKQGHILHVVDFGLARSHAQAVRARNFGGRVFQGTRLYSSINSDDLREQSWGDDLESLGYMLVYLLKRTLPWDHKNPGWESLEEFDERAKRLKSTMLGQDIASDLPEFFGKYLDMTRLLDFEDRPDYRSLRQGFRRVFTAHGFKHDNVFDWTERLYTELNGNVSP